MCCLNDFVGTTRHHLYVREAPLGDHIRVIIVMSGMPLSLWGPLAITHMLPCVMRMFHHAVMAHVLSVCVYETPPTLVSKHMVSHVSVGGPRAITC
jgi:hypothetical protein